MATPEVIDQTGIVFGPVVVLSFPQGMSPGASGSVFPPTLIRGTFRFGKGHDRHRLGPRR